MSVHVFQFDEWYLNKSGDWDAYFYYLVVDGEGIELVHAGSSYWKEQMRLNNPDRVEHDWTLATHYTNLDACEGSDRLKEEYPEIWDRLNRWKPFVDRRSKE